MALDDPPAGREADAAALVVAAAAREHLEDRAVAGQADPVVADGERPAGLIVACRDRDHGRLAIVELQGVGDEVLEDAGQAGVARLEDRQPPDLHPPRRAPPPGGTPAPAVLPPWVASRLSTSSTTCDVSTCVQASSPWAVAYSRIPSTSPRARTIP